jgi:hypothetical protein
MDLPAVIRRGDLGTDRQGEGLRSDVDEAAKYRRRLPEILI